MTDAVDAVEEKLSSEDGIAVRYQKDNNSPKKGVFRLESAAGTGGAVVKTLVLSRLHKKKCWNRRREVEEVRIELKDVIGAFGSPTSKIRNKAATVLLAATRSKHNRRVQMSPLRFTIDDDTISPSHDNVVKCLCSGSDYANGVLTNFLPTEGVDTTDKTISFFKDTFAADGVVGELSRAPLILQVSDELFEIGKWAGVVAPVFAVFASMVSRYETVQGLKSDFIDLLARWSKVERNLPEEEKLKGDLLELAEDFLFKSGWRRHFASKDFQGNLTRLARRMDQAVQSQTLQHTVETAANVVARGETLTVLDSKMDIVLRQTSSNANEKAFDWLNVKSMLPQTRLLMGREAELKEIGTNIERVGTITALVGVAGCGKSHLSREAAHHWKCEAAEGENRIVLFFNASSESSCNASVVRTMEHLSLETVLQEDGRPVPTKELSRRMHKRIAEAPRNVSFLLILDDAPVSADGPDLLNEWFGLADDCSWSNMSVVLTSQSSAYSLETSLGNIKVTRVKPLPTEVSLALLMESFTDLQEEEDEMSAATELVVDFLHNLPVAILAVAGLVWKRSWTFQRYLRILREKKVKAGVDSVGEVLEDALFEARLDSNLAGVLDVAAFVGSDNIPLSLLGAEELVEELCRLNLLQVATDEQYSMHGLIQEAAQRDRSPCNAIVELKKAVEPYDDDVPSTWRAAVAMLPHLEALRRVATVDYVLKNLTNIDVEAYTLLVFKSAKVYDTVLCQLESCRLLNEDCLAVERAFRGATTNHKTIAATLHNLGGVYHALGNYVRSIDYYEQALTMMRAMYGATNHKDIANALNDLGNVYASRGDNKLSIDYYDQALTMMRAMYGATTNHRDIPGTLHNLGAAYSSLGQHESAKDHYEQALSMQQAVHGATTDHKDIAATLNQLGVVHKALGDLVRSKEYFEQALSMMRALYEDTNHTYISGTLNNLGAVYEALGDLVRSKEYFEEALSMIRAVHGATTNHKDIASPLNNLGAVYKSLGDYERSRDYYEQCLSMQRDLFGATHEKIARTLGNLGDVHNFLKNYAQSKELYEQALSMLRAVRGATCDEAHVAYWLLQLASVCQALGDTELAARYRIEGRLFEMRFLSRNDAN